MLILPFFLRLFSTTTTTTITRTTTSTSAPSSFKFVQVLPSNTSRQNNHYKNKIKIRMFSSSSSTRNNENENEKCSNKEENFTTNAHDLAEAARLQQELRNNTSDPSPSSKTTTTTTTIVPNVSIDEGANKYVLIQATNQITFKRESFVVSKKGASYHRNAAESFLPKLQQQNLNKSLFTDIDITGGGRIFYSWEDKKIRVFGYSYGFGRADHALACEVIRKDERFSDFDIDWSNEGY